MVETISDLEIFIISLGWSLFIGGMGWIANGFVTGVIVFAITFLLLAMAWGRDS